MADRSLSMNQVVAFVVNALAGILALTLVIPGGWQVTQWLNQLQGVQLPSFTVTLVLALVLTVLPKLFGKDWDGYVATWHACRLTIAWILFAILYPFNLWIRWGSRLAPLWAALSVVAIFGAFQVADLRRDRPLVEQSITDLAEFLNEHPRMDVPAEQQVRLLLAGFTPLKDSAEDLYPHLRDFTWALERLYLKYHPAEKFETRALEVAARLEEKAGKRSQTPKRIDVILTDLLLTRLYLHLSHQGKAMPYTYKALLLQEQMDSPAWARHAEPSLREAYSTLNDLKSNLMAVTNRHCAYKYEDYKSWSRRKQREPRKEDELLDEAERRWEEQAQSRFSSRLSRSRAVNNRAGLVIEQSRPRLATLTASILPASQKEADELISIEERLLEQRDLLAGILRSSANSNMMITLADVDLQLAQVNALIHDNSKRRGKASPGRLKEVHRYLRLATDDVLMAVRCGFGAEKFKANPHDLGLCRLLSFNLQTARHSHEVNNLFSAAQAQALERLEENGVSKFSCPLCRSQYELIGAAESPTS